MEDRTLRFAEDVRTWLLAIPRMFLAQEDVEQLLRSSGSVGAKYREANESLGKKNFLMHIKICRKEEKESMYWLRLLAIHPSYAGPQNNTLINEAHELEKIFGAIFRKTSS